MTLFALTAKAFHDPVIILALLTLFAAMVYGVLHRPTTAQRRIRR